MSPKYAPRAYRYTEAFIKKRICTDVITFSVLRKDGEPPKLKQYDVKPLDREEFLEELFDYSQCEEIALIRRIRYALVVLPEPWGEMLQGYMLITPRTTEADKEEVRRYLERRVYEGYSDFVPDMEHYDIPETKSRRRDHYLPLGEREQ